MKEQEGKIVKKIAKKNQIVIATLAVMIAAAGYMNYSGKLFPGKTKTQETNSELANKELLDISDEENQKFQLEIGCKLIEGNDNH